MFSATEEKGVLADNIEVIIYGDMKQKIVDVLQLLPSTNAKKDPILLEVEADHPSHDEPEPQIDLIKAEEDQEYLENVRKLLKLKLPPEEQKEDAKSGVDGKGTATSSGFTWSDFKRVSATISSPNVWLTMNFHLVSDFFFDPYLNNAAAANIGMMIMAVDVANARERKNVIELFKKVSTSKRHSAIRYHSQMLLLNSGYYQTFTDNIVLALCELPEIEPIGPCLLVAFGRSSTKFSMKSEMESVLKEDDKKLCKVVEIDEDRLGDINYAKEIIKEIYAWLIDTHQAIKPEFDLSSAQRRELSNWVDTAINKKLTRSTCNLI
jgi:hypothetical protein